MASARARSSSVASSGSRRSGSAVDAAALPEPAGNNVSIDMRPFAPAQMLAVALPADPPQNGARTAASKTPLRTYPICGTALERNFLLHLAQIPAITGKRRALVQARAKHEFRKAVFDVLVSLFRIEHGKTRAAPRPGRWQLFAFSDPPCGTLTHKR